MPNPLNQPSNAIPGVKCCSGLTLAALLTLGGGCSSPMADIDARTDALLAEASGALGPDTASPTMARNQYPRGDALSFPGRDLYRPGTNNPGASDIEFIPRPDRDTRIEAEADAALDRLGPVAGAVTTLDLTSALGQALASAREYRTAEEEYILSALRLLIERHRWGPRFFDDVSATVSGDATDNSYDTALRIVNELGVTHRLPYGGEVSARLLARATEDLHRRVAGENVQDAEIILGANLPLLRGAGLAAVEPRIAAERGLVYDARAFERFRRTFLVSIARDFLNLVVQQQSISNAETQLERLREFEDRQTRLAQSGRAAAFDVALAQQDVLFAEDSLRSQRESYKFSVDRFKIRLGMNVDQAVAIEASSLGLPAPEEDMDRAVRLALQNRLDLQTRRDQLDDARRGIDIARNALLPDLAVTGSVSIPTDEFRDRDGLRFNSEEASFAVGVTFGLPFDREIERISLRQAQISNEQARRNYDEFRDTLIIEVRDAVREIERALFSLRLQEDNILIAQRRLDAIEAAPDRARARDRSEAADGMTRAEDQRDRAARDLEVAILEYLLSTGTLRVDQRGRIKPLAGMVIDG